MYFHLSPLDFLFLIPGLILGLWAQGKIKKAYNTYSKVSTAAQVPAHQVAQSLLSTYSHEAVTITSVQGQLTDHYNPSNQTLALSSGVYGSNSIAAIAIAAHEIGHAMQDQNGYAPLRLRSAMVPVVNISSYLSFGLVFLSLLLSFDTLLTIGIVIFGLSFLFTLVTLPVEFDASKRALAMLADGNYLTQSELPRAKAVLDAAALTYVASAVTALLQLLRLLFSYGRSRSRD